MTRISYVFTLFAPHLSRECVWLLEHLPDGHQPKTTREYWLMHVTRCLITRTCFIGWNTRSNSLKRNVFLVHYMDIVHESIFGEYSAGYILISCLPPQGLTTWEENLLQYASFPLLWFGERNEDVDINPATVAIHINSLDWACFTRQHFSHL
jgi:hypothetical protein